MVWVVHVLMCVFAKGSGVAKGMRPERSCTALCGAEFSHSRCSIVREVIGHSGYFSASVYRCFQQGAFVFVGLSI